MEQLAKIPEAGIISGALAVWDFRGPCGEKSLMLCEGCIQTLRCKTVHGIASEHVKLLDTGCDVHHSRTACIELTVIDYIEATSLALFPSVLGTLP